MKIIGIRPSSFTGEDKSQISGRNIYLTYPLEKGEGHGFERIFVTDAKRFRKLFWLVSTLFGRFHWISLYL
jgi:hypothetical protein